MQGYKKRKKRAVTGAILNEMLEYVTQLGCDIADNTRIQMYKAEILLLHREISNRKRSFGVDAYDKLYGLTMMVQDIESNEDNDNILLLFNKVKNDVDDLSNKKDEKTKQIDTIKTTMTDTTTTDDNHYIDHDIDDSMVASKTTVSSKIISGGNYVLEMMSKTKLEGEIMLLDHEIWSKKQQFGIQLYETITEMEDNNNFDSIINNESIRKCYEDTTKDIEQTIQKIENKHKDIMELGGSPPVSETTIQNTDSADSTVGYVDISQARQQQQHSDISPFEIS